MNILSIINEQSKKIIQQKNETINYLLKIRIAIIKKSILKVSNDTL